MKCPMMVKEAVIYVHMRKKKFLGKTQRGIVSGDNYADINSQLLNMMSKGYKPILAKGKKDIYLVKPRMNAEKFREQLRKANIR